MGSPNISRYSAHPRLRSAAPAETRQEDDDGILHSVSAACCSPPRDDGTTSSSATITNLSPPKLRRKGKRTTAIDAYHNGTLLQYMIERCSDLSDICSSYDCRQDDFESNWQGHQPLTPPNWTSTCGVSSCGPASCGLGRGGGGGVLSASELRLMRGRRKRGVVSLPRRSYAYAGSSLLSKGSSSFDNCEEVEGFPAESADPRLTEKEKKWKPAL